MLLEWKTILVSGVIYRAMNTTELEMKIKKKISYSICLDAKDEESILI